VISEGFLLLFCKQLSPEKKTCFDEPGSKNWFPEQLPLLRGFLENFPKKKRTNANKTKKKGFQKQFVC